MLQGEDLKTLLESTLKHNNLIKSQEMEAGAKAKELEAQESEYYPTLDIGALYQRYDVRSALIPGDIYSAYAKLSVDIYDGGRRSALVEQKKKEFYASQLSKEAMQKGIVLEVLRDYFQILNLQSIYKATQDSQKLLLAQLSRVKKFYEAHLATQENISKLQAAYDTNTYELEAIKFQIFSLRKTLELKTGMAATKLEAAEFRIPQEEDIVILESTKALIAQKNAIRSTAESLESVYYPSVRLEDTYSLNGYGRTDVFHPAGVDKQNKLLVTLNMRLFDNASIGQKKEAVLLRAKALHQQISYKQKEQKLQYELSLFRIETSKAKLKSAKSALRAAQSTFETVEKKYNAGVVDNIAYLDALAVLTKAKAICESAHNDVEVAYAMFYFYSGKNLMEYIK